MYSNRCAPSAMALTMMAPVVTAGLNPPPEIGMCSAEQNRTMLNNIRPTATPPAVTLKPMAKPKKELPAWVLVVAVCRTAWISRKEKKSSAANACPALNPAPDLSGKVRVGVRQTWRSPPNVDEEVPYQRSKKTTQELRNPIAHQATEGELASVREKHPQRHRFSEKIRCGAAMSHELAALR
ncbi:hypothetical protein QOT17_003769 [Balamuthia mandrillaris]